VSGFALLLKCWWCEKARRGAKIAWTATNKKAPDDAGAFELLI
jgi:hypothetical protein